MSRADTTAPDLVFDHVCVCRGGRLILEDVCATVPAGSSTSPPPAPAAASTAFWIAAVSFVVPSPFAPKSLTFHVAACAATATITASIVDTVFMNSPYSEIYLKVLFKKAHGVTMRDYRNACDRTPSVCDRGGKANAER